jgi:hypothetical protein
VPIPTLGYGSGAWTVLRKRIENGIREAAREITLKIVTMLGS